MAALVPFGEQIVPVLVEALRSENDDLQLLTLQIVREIGPEAKDAVPAVIHILRNGDRLLRSVAVTTLGAIGPAAKEAVPLVQQLIEREDDLLRAFAAHSLAQIDSRQRTGALSVLLRLLEGEDLGVRLLAEAALAQMIEHLTSDKQYESAVYCDGPSFPPLLITRLWHSIHVGGSHLSASLRTT